MTVHRVIILAIGGVIALFTGGCSQKEVPDDTENIYTFRSVRYLRTANALQKLDETARADALRRIAWDDRDFLRVIILCRMLFTAPEGEVFKRPELGGPGGLGATNADDWPLEPIAVVDGVPFMVIACYAGAGMKKEDYLNYCLSHCNWTSNTFQEGSPGSRLEALERLIDQGPWRRPLLPREHDTLLSQLRIQDAEGWPQKGLNVDERLTRQHRP